MAGGGSEDEEEPTVDATIAARFLDHFEPMRGEGNSEEVAPDRMIILRRGEARLQVRLSPLRDCQAISALPTEAQER